MRLSSRTWANLALGAALFGGLGRVYAQPLNEPPPRPLTLDLGAKNVIATTNAPPKPPPFTVKMTVPDDALSPAAKPIRAVDYQTEAEPAPTPPQLPAQVSVVVAGPVSVALGEPLHYELIVRNTGNVPACRVQVQDPLPSSARLLLADPAAELREGSLLWNLGTLEAGAERRLKVDLQHFGTVKMQQTPRVAYSAATGLQAEVVRPPFIVALYGPNTATQGETVTFQIQVSNDGTVPIRHIVLRDQLPPGLLYPRGYVIEAELDDLAPGRSRTVRLDAVAAKVGRFVNEVIATADGGLRVTSRCAVEVVAGTNENLGGGSSFATGR